MQQKLYLPRLLSSFSIQRVPAGHLCLVLSTSHLFLDFGEAVGFHPFFARYFVLHNSYIRILAIHRYKSSWRCSNVVDAIYLLLPLYLSLYCILEKLLNPIPFSLVILFYIIAISGFQLFINIRALRYALRDSHCLHIHTQAQRAWCPLGLSFELTLS